MEQKFESLIVFCGLFSYSDETLKKVYHTGKFEDFEDFYEKNQEIKVLKNIFYPNFSNIIISKRCHDLSHPHDCSFHHLMLKEPDVLRNLSLDVKAEEQIKFSVTKVDIFLFPETISSGGNEKLGIYAFHVRLDEIRTGSERVSSFINRIRSFDSNHRITKGDKKYSTLEFIENHIIFQKISDSMVLNIMGNKLKTFTILNSDTKIENTDSLLIDVGTAQLANMQSNEHATQNATEMLDELKQSNMISVYANWKALALFDSFTVVGTNLSDLSKTWGTSYLLIYIHCLKMKFYFFHVNAELSNFHDLSKDPRLLRAKFIEFITINNLFSISYNILPNKIYRSVHASLDITNEVHELEKKISTMNMIINEQYEKRLNRLIFLLALLGAVSVIFHASEFIMKVFSVKEQYYPHLGLLVATTVILILAAYLFMLRKRNKPK
jgi:hypothetical protein